ncbi:hypothetical protein [Allokutzneria oryzae]|uniref:Uncharacterized protein n=1 Tax=Allokutzneria oryzae TaxID=1378989 RepID=A0ABV6ABF6_9PSEU
MHDETNACPHVNKPVPSSDGEWSGRLSENQGNGSAPCLTWCFTFYPEVVLEGESESSAVTLTVDSVPLPVTSWRDMAGQTVECTESGEPVEASAYLGYHLFYEEVELKIHEQRGSRIRASARVFDSDSFEDALDPLSVEAWLDFTGIDVQLEDVRSAGAAAARLRDVIDASGLSYPSDDADTFFQFTPEPEGQSQV